MCLNNTAKNEIPAFYKRIIQLLIKRWCFKKFGLLHFNYSGRKLYT